MDGFISALRSRSTEALPFWYLATPYTNYPDGREAAFKNACAAAAYLMANDVPVYCPIAHSHPIADYGKLDAVDHDFWVKADEPMVQAAGGLIICMMEGWGSSAGMAHEIKCFEDAEKPIVFMHWPPIHEE
jgi:hypothetical protein